MRMFVKSWLRKTVEELGQLDILVSNAAYQDRDEEIEKITSLQWETTFRTNIDALLIFTRAAMPQ